MNVPVWHTSLEPPKGYENVHKIVSMLPDRVMVEMAQKVEETEGGVLLLESDQRKFRPAFAFILASGVLNPPNPLCDKEEFKPGEIVLVNPADGKRIQGWEHGGYKAEEEVRFLGIVCERWGKPLEMPLTESILASFDPQTEEYKPRLANVLVRLPERREVSEGGIVLVDNMKVRESDTGIIIAKGPYATEVKVGDMVVFERRALMQLKFDGKEDLALLDQDGIYAVLDPIEA